MLDLLSKSLGVCAIMVFSGVMVCLSWFWLWFVCGRTCRSLTCYASRDAGGGCDARFLSCDFLWACPEGGTCGLSSVIYLLSVAEP